MSVNIALIGCGKMGSAMLRGWLKAGIENRVFVLDPQGLPDEFKDYAPNPVSYYDKVEDFTKDSPAIDLYVFAVKPQIMNKVCEDLAPALPHDALIVSIAAGQTIETFEKHFGATQPVIRAMPNTPAAIGKGITVAVTNSRVSPEQKSQAHEVLKATGACEWIDDEHLMDAVTALSGSGPAYFFRFTEALAEAGEKLDLPRDLAMKLARSTFEGSAALSEIESDTPLSTLRENVTSPGGTTEAGLNVMNDENGVQELMDKTTKAARDRGRELNR